MKVQRASAEFLRKLRPPAAVLSARVEGAAWAGMAAAVRRMTVVAAAVVAARLIFLFTQGERGCAGMRVLE